MLWLARVRVESDEIVPKIRLSPKFGACAGGSSENGAGNILPAHYKECSLDNMASFGELYEHSSHARPSFTS